MRLPLIVFTLVLLVPVAGFFGMCVAMARSDWR